MRPHGNFQPSIKEETILEPGEYGDEIGKERYSTPNRNNGISFPIYLIFFESLQIEKPNSLDAIYLAIKPIKEGFGGDGKASTALHVSSD